MATQEVLQEIRDHLGDLPEKLARVLSNKGQRDEKGRFLPSGGFSGPQGATEVKIPNKWHATEHFAHSLGRFLPGASQLGGILGSFRELGDSWRNLRTAFGSRPVPPGGRFNPIAPPPIPQAMAGPMAPPLPVKAASPNTSITSALPLPSAGPQVAQTPAKIQELVNELKALREEMRRMREATRQTEPDQADDSERTQKPKELEAEKAESGKPWKSTLPLSTQHPDPRYSKPQGTFRREKDVPSHNDSGNGLLEKAASVALDFI